MTPEQLIAEFETVAESPDGVARLRELILSLAVRGKLVEQDQSDESAKSFLDSLKSSEFASQDRLLEPIKSGDELWGIPDSWAWERLRTVTKFEIGKTPPTKESSHWEGKDGYSWISIADMKHGAEVTHTKKRVSESARQTVFKRVPVPVGTMLMSFKLTIGKVCRAGVETYHNEAIISLQPANRTLDNYLFATLSTFSLSGDTNAAIKGRTLNKTSLTNLMVAVPPLNEQPRIVAKIDELMGLLDRLESARNSRETTRTALRDSALHALQNADSHKQVKTAWQRVANNIHDLFTKPEDIKPLKDTILQLAVKGKLVPQDPNDEPASVLLKKIAAEKQKLVDNSEMLEPKPLLDSNQAEKPFPVPSTWTWVRFEEIVDIRSGITKGRKLKNRKLVSVPYLRVANVQRGFLNLSIVKEIELPENEIEKYRLDDGDLLITEGGDWDKVGRTTIWRNELPYCAHQNHVFRARIIISEQNENWLELYLNSFSARTYFAGASKQTTNLASINKTQLRGCPVALPPREEQHRIATRYNEIMDLITLIQSNLTGINNTHLATATVLVSSVNAQSKEFQTADA